MKKQNRGLTPREMKIGTRTLITFEAAAKWRAEREAASTATPEKAAPSAPPNENGCPAGQPNRARSMCTSEQSVRCEGTRCGQISSWRRSQLPAKMPFSVARVAPRKPGFRSGLPRLSPCGRHFAESDRMPPQKTRPEAKRRREEDKRRRESIQRAIEQARQHPSPTFVLNKTADQGASNTLAEWRALLDREREHRRRMFETLPTGGKQHRVAVREWWGTVSEVLKGIQNVTDLG